MEGGFALIGRQDDVCDIALQHPSVSRVHAAMQHRADGKVLVYDLGSTHGTSLNKQSVPPKTYTEVIKGDVLCFGSRAGSCG